MPSRATAPIFLAFLVVVMSVSVGIVSFGDYKVWFDAPGRVILSMSSIFFSLLVADMVWAKDELLQVESGDEPNGFVRNPTGNLRAKVAILFVAGIFAWVLSLLYAGSLWRQYNATTDPLDRIFVFLTLSLLYATATALVFFAYKFATNVKTQ